MDEDRTRILLRINALGSNARLYPTLSAADVAAFEAHHRVELPDDHRWFLTEVGDGGGPVRITGGRFPDWERGLWPLAHWFSAVAKAERDLPAGFLARPSPLSAGLVARPEPDFNELDWFAGAVCLCHAGCGWRDVLVVSGPSRGQVFSTDGGYSPPSWLASSFARWIAYRLGGA